MSDDPRPLKAVLLGDATTEESRKFAELLAEQCAAADRQDTYRDWLFIPSPSEYERLRKYWGGDEKCPKCQRGRLIVEIYHGNLGDSIYVKCGWGAPGCDFKEYVSDD